MEPMQRRQTVNALAIRAKKDHAAIPELWGMVEGLIKAICGRYCRGEEHSKRYEYDDLCQNAFFGFLKAVDAYDPVRGAFSTILDLCIHNSCRAIIKKFRPEVDPINVAVSLDKPLGGTEDTILSDYLPDPHSTDFVEDVSIYSIAQTILAEAELLPNPLHTRIIRECLYWGRTHESFADELSISRQAVSSMQETAVHWLRRRPVIRSMRDEFFQECKTAKRESAIDPYRTKSMAGFKNSYTSIVEDIVLNMLDATNTDGQDKPSGKKEIL